MVKTNKFTGKFNYFKLKKIIWRFFRATIIIGVCFMIIYPIIIKFSTSLKSYDDLYDPTVFFIPRNPTFQNFKILISAVNYPVLLLKTVGITLLISILQLTSCTLVSYGLARFEFPGRKIIFTCAILTLIIPPQVILLPIYMRFRFFNPLQLFTFWGELSGVSLIDSIWPFILLSMGAIAFKNGLYIYLLRQYFINVPKALEEAAYVDGATRFQIFYKIMLPGALPMLITVFLFSFVWQWNDYYYTSVLALDLPVFSTRLMGMSFSSLGAAASSMISAASSAPQFLLHIFPLLILYLFTQRYFMQSIEKSGIVG